MNQERQQAETFCKDFFGTSPIQIDGISMVEALSAYLARVKAQMLRAIQTGHSHAGQQLELFEKQGVLF